MARAYADLHRLGIAHSVECWLDGKLAGGLYGVRVGRVFCGESMFSRIDNASKAVFIVLSRTLARAGFDLIDCQVPNPHLTSLGVFTISRRRFLGKLHQSSEKNTWPGITDFQQTFAMLSGKDEEGP